MVHLVPGLSSPANGIAVAARLIASAQGADLVDCRAVKDCNLSTYDEVWVHSMWTPQVWRACRAVLKAGKPLVRMTHGCLDPVRVRFHGWKKWLVAPVERALFGRTARVAVTGAWEQTWCAQWGVRGPFENVDLKRFFGLDAVRAPEAGAQPKSGGGAQPKSEAGAQPKSGCGAQPKSGCGAQPRVEDRPLHLLYLGRRHPLKGLDMLEAAVAAVAARAPGTGAQPRRTKPPPDQTIRQSGQSGNPDNQTIRQSGQSRNPDNQTIKQSNNQTIHLRVVSDAFGEEKERVWDWCDVLVLPTLSENFGLVVAEALERGKRVVTTDGAPAWEGQPGVVYLRGYRDGTPARRVELLAAALMDLCADFSGACVR